MLFTCSSHSIRTRFDGISLVRPIVRLVCMAVRPHEEKTMTALNLICQGVATASKLMALLFVAPAWAAEPPVPASVTALRQMHAIDSALEIHWLESLGGLRVVRALQNPDPRPTAPLGSDWPCGSEADDDNDGNAHAVLNLDEALADLQRRSAAAGSESDVQAFFVVDGAVRYLAVVPPPGMRGDVTLTVRPRRGASEHVALGHIDGAGKAILIPRAAREAADDLAIEAIELESRSRSEVSWVTVPLQSSPRRSTAASLASASR